MTESTRASYASSWTWWTKEGYLLNYIDLISLNTKMKPDMSLLSNLFIARNEAEVRGLGEVV